MTDEELQTAKERVEWYKLAERLESGEMLPEHDRERMAVLYGGYTQDRHRARQAIIALLAEVDRLRVAMQRLLIEERYQTALAEEREACARIAETHHCRQPPEHVCEEVIAATIRARSNQLP